MDPKLCNASPQGIGHAGEYGKMGFSPCGGYVAHESDRPCDLSDMVFEVLPETICTCMTTTCPCGEFLSHSVFEPCTAKK
jgi:hypothetical protein